MNAKTTTPYGAGYGYADHLGYGYCRRCADDPHRGDLDRYTPERGEMCDQCGHLIGACDGCGEQRGDVRTVRIRRPGEPWERADYCLDCRDMARAAANGATSWGAWGLEPLDGFRETGRSGTQGYFGHPDQTLHPNTETEQ